MSELAENILDIGYDSLLNHAQRKQAVAALLEEQMDGPWTDEEMRAEIYALREHTRGLREAAQELKLLRQRFRQQHTLNEAEAIRCDVLIDFIAEAVLAAWKE